MGRRAYATRRRKYRKMYEQSSVKSKSIPLVWTHDYIEVYVPIAFDIPAGVTWLRGSEWAE